MSSQATASAITTVNTYVTDIQDEPAVTGLTGGGWVVSWQSSGQDNPEEIGFSGIYQQQYAADGTLVGTETLVNTYTTSQQADSAVTALADGGWVVSWASTTHDVSLSGSNVYLQRYNADGTKNGEETLVDTPSSSSRKDISITTLADGGWLVTWTAADGNDGILQRRYNAEGTAADDETQVNIDTVGVQMTSVVTALADGGWVVTWNSALRSDGDDGIYHRYFDADGVGSASETRVNSSAATSSSTPTVAALADGGWVVSWTSFDEDAESTGICQQRYDADGTTVGEETRVSTFTINEQRDPSVTALADGGWLVTWGGNGSPARLDKNFLFIYQQRYDAEGAAVGVETIVSSTDNDGNAYSPSVTALADGSWVVTWRTYSIDALGHFSDPGDIHQRHFAPDKIGTAAGETLNGTGWSETLSGLGGTDTLNGGRGDDVLDGGKGADRMVGGAGNDTYIVDNSGDVVKEASNGGSDTVRTALDHYILALNVENLVLTGKAALYATGNGSANTLIGNKGANRLSGLAGNDSIDGGAGKDILIGGAGRDTLKGSAGADTFVFALGDTAATKAKADTILDMNGKQGDHIDLHLIDAREGQAGNQKFHFVGTDVFSGHSGELRYEKAASDTYIYGDTDGDRKADFAIHLDDALTLKDDFFVL